MKNISVPLGFILVLVLLPMTWACVGVKEAPDTDDSGNGENGTESADPTGHGRVEIETSDGITIIGTMIRISGIEPRPACLLVHQLGSDRSAYNEFQKKLMEAGINSLAIDMRGHGESTQNGELDFEDFRNEQWAECKNDIKAGLDFLRDAESVNPLSIGIVGASIGANLAVVEAADEMIENIDNTPACLVLLSPGADYHGIQPLHRAHDLEHIPVYIASAEEDRQSFRGSQSLSQAARGGELFSIPGSDHGTGLFDANPDFMAELIDWLSINLGGSAGSSGTTPAG